MSSLSEFLLARIAEDEAVARAAADVTAPPWEWRHLPPPLDYGLAGVHPIQGGLSVIVPSRSGDMWPDRDPAAHIARWDPARVLAECQAKRALVVMCQPDPIDAELRELATTNPAAWELVGPLVEQADEERRLTLAFLAFVYADHPDYRAEWKP